MAAYFYGEPINVQWLSGQRVTSCIIAVCRELKRRA